MIAQLWNSVSSPYLLFEKMFVVILCYTYCNVLYRMVLYCTCTQRCTLQYIDNTTLRLSNEPSISCTCIHTNLQVSQFKRYPELKHAGICFFRMLIRSSLVHIIHATYVLEITPTHLSSLSRLLLSGRVIGECQMRILNQSTKYSQSNQFNPSINRFD